MIRSAAALAQPRVSVITPIHNGEEYLAAAIASILAQSWTDFEYLLVDDASTDGSLAILRDLAAGDDRLRVLVSERCANHSNAINLALRIAQGEYVAICDADDLAHPERIARQVHYLDNHPEVGVLGAQVQQIDSAGHVVGNLAFPRTCAMARWTILFSTPVLHSAAMVRRALLAEIGGYDDGWQYANDYSLWAALIERTGITNLPEMLVSYRIHAQQMSAARAKSQQAEVWLLIHRMLVERLSLRVPPGTIGDLYHGIRNVPLADAAALERAAWLLAQIRERYLAVEQPDPTTAAQIDAYCAARLVRMAWVHRRSHRAASRVLLQQALEIDPLLWRRPQTCSLLRNLYRQARLDPEHRTLT